MLKNVYYRYLGTNGVIESPVHLEDIYYVRLIELGGRPQPTYRWGEICKKNSCSRK